MTVKQLIKLLESVPDFLKDQEIVVFTDHGERSGFESPAIYSEHGILHIPTIRLN